MAAPSWRSSRRGLGRAEAEEQPRLARVGERGERRHLGPRREPRDERQQRGGLERVRVVAELAQRVDDEAHVVEEQRRLGARVGRDDVALHPLGGGAHASSAFALASHLAHAASGAPSGGACHAARAAPRTRRSRRPRPELGARGVVERVEGLARLGRARDGDALAHEPRRGARL